MREFPEQYNLQSHDVLYFSHIPKTAGMTFRTIIEDQFHAEEVCPATLNAQLAEMPLEELNRYRLFRGHLGFIDIPNLLPGKRIIDVTFLREPIARVISHYEYIRRMPGDPHYPLVKDMTLAEYCYNLTVSKVGKNIQTYHVAKTLQFELDDLTSEEILSIAKKSLDRFAFVGLVERFQDSLFLLSYIFGWKPIINTRKENAAKSQKALDQISASTIDVIKENTALDDELYQYAKAIFETRFTQMTQTLIAQYGSSCGLDGSLDGSTATEQNLTDAQYAELLNLHYQQRFAALQQPTSTSCVYDFSLPLWGSGWQRRECPVDQPLYRWTGPGTTTTLDLPIKVDINTDFLIEFRIICAEVTPDDILDSLTVAVNQQPIEIDILHSDKGIYLFRGFVPRTVLSDQSPFTECTFQVNRVTSLNANNPLELDTRPIGLAFNLVQMFPVNLKRQQSALISFFENEAWRTAADFIQKYADPEETVIAPLIFRVELENAVQNYSAFLKQNRFNWVVLHKDSLNQIDVVLTKLALRGLAPVFANQVFIVYSSHKLPRLAYTSTHVKPLYVDRLKSRLPMMAKLLPNPVKKI